MRYAHLDEAGISSGEPVVCVAGIVSNPDRQWKALHQYLLDMADDLLPEDIREGAIFHAKDIWHGRGIFDKNRFDRAYRNKILLELAKIPKKFDVPIVLGAIDKREFSHHPNCKQLCYAMAFAMAVVSVEYFLLQFCGGEEIAQLVVEDTNEMRQHAKWGYDRLKDEAAWAGKERGFLPVRNIVEDPMFAQKTRSSILQVADTIAFVSCRRIRGRTDVQFLFDEFAENFISFPSWSDAAPPGGRLGG